MHRKPEAELLPLDIELERTLRNLKNVRSVESAVMVKQQETHQNIPTLAIKRPQRQRMKKDFWRPVIRDEYSTIRQPAIEANKFELKPTLITMVQQHQYTGHPVKTPMSIWVDF